MRCVGTGEAQVSAVLPKRIERIWADFWRVGAPGAQTVNDLVFTCPMVHAPEWVWADSGGPTDSAETCGIKETSLGPARTWPQ